MTTTDAAASLGDVPGRRSGTPKIGRAFLAILRRDIVVTGEEIGAFLAQVLLQPLFILFVFGKVFADLGFTTNDYGSVADRPRCRRKIVYATLRALTAALIMFPLAFLVLGSLSLSWSDAPMVAVFLVLGSLVGSAVGLTLGTFVEPQRLQLVFALVLTPLLFTGSVQFPWPALDYLRWFQVLSALNPMTYLSERLRGEMVPETPHIATWICVLALLAFLTLFTVAGAIGVPARALD
jgi:ABC-2 type transport system permease protein